MASPDIIKDLGCLALLHREAALSGDVTRRLELAMEIEELGARVRERTGAANEAAERMRPAAAGEGVSRQ